MIDIVSVENVLQMELAVPSFQRPYKWQQKNVLYLLEDINNAIEESRKYESFNYRIGTIILYNNPDTLKKDIVDGQQRLFTLAMIAFYLDHKFECNLLKEKYNDKQTANNLHLNYLCIKDWFTLKGEDIKQQFKVAFSNILQVVVLEVNSITSAFQLFDSQNTRGKALDPHDLLKAYHLRAMKNNPYEMYHAVEKWESFEPKSISNLFDAYLFPILNWAHKEKAPKFSSNYIDYYKGVGESEPYTYAKRAKKASPIYLITEPIISGNDFFEMVAHYLTMLNDINTEIKNRSVFDKINKIVDSKDKSIGFRYSIDLFKCALLYYYDKFHNFEEKAVKKLFSWAMMLRIDMDHLGADSVNKYAIGEFNAYYTNCIAMFSEIERARFPSTISNLKITIIRKPDQARVDKWNELYKSLKEINMVDDK